MAETLTLTSLTGSDIGPQLHHLGRLRIEVFRAFPYLYDGSADNEQDYGKTYRDAADVLLVIAQDHSGRVVGASTGLPLVAEGPMFTGPFEQAGIDPAGVYYFGESVLLPEFRGRGIGKQFMQRREAHARSLPGMTHVAMCGVNRPDDHPHRPTDYQPLDPFWMRCGFTKQPEMTVTLSWKQVDAEEETVNTLTFWIKAL